VKHRGTSSRHMRTFHELWNLGYGVGLLGEPGKQIVVESSHDDSLVPCTRLRGHWARVIDIQGRVIDPVAPERTGRYERIHRGSREPILCHGRDCIRSAPVVDVGSHTYSGTVSMSDKHVEESKGHEGR
jgi:hypothetical protein